MVCSLLEDHPEMSEKTHVAILLNNISMDPTTRASLKDFKLLMLFENLEHVYLFMDHHDAHIYGTRIFTKDAVPGLYPPSMLEFIVA